MNRLSNPYDGYTERHHILPRSFDGTKESDNNHVVKLSAREHFFVHYLLTKIYPRQSDRWKKMVSAFAMFCGKRSEKYGHIKITSRKYNIIRELSMLNSTGRKHTEETRRMISESKMGNTVFKGKKHTEEAKRMISEKRMGIKFSEDHINNLKLSHTGYVMPLEQKQKISAAHMGKVHGPMSEEQKKLISEMKRGNTYRRGAKLSDETKEKMTKCRLGNIWVVHADTGITHNIKPEQLDEYLSNGYVRGRGKLKNKNSDK